MQTLLITGVSGFVGGHFARFLAETRPDLSVHGLSRSKPTWDFIPDRDQLLEKITFHQMDLLDMDATKHLLGEIGPDYILHLASLSSVAESWKQPVDSFLNNTNVFLNIIDTVRQQGIDCRILSVGSSEEYGIVSPEALPLGEDRPTMATSPYGAARVSEENLALVYSKGFRLQVCCTRSFNHIGPGQDPRFVVSGIAKQFVEIQSSGRKPVIRIGNGAIVRDFTDIRDVVRAYGLLLERGRAGEIYNVCSGSGHRITDVVELLSHICGVEVDVEQESDLLRPVDNPMLIGSYDKIENELGWRPQVGLEDSLRTMVDYWSSRVAVGG